MSIQQAIDQIIILTVAELKLPNLAHSIHKLKQQLIDQVYDTIKSKLI